MAAATILYVHQYYIIAQEEISLQLGAFLCMTAIVKCSKRKCAILKRCIIPIRDGERDSMHARLTYKHELVQQKAQNAEHVSELTGNKSVGEQQRRRIIVAVLTDFCTT